RGPRSLDRPARPRPRGEAPRRHGRAALLRDRIPGGPRRPRGRAVFPFPWSKAVMIVSRAPVRFSLGGGGTDLPAYSDRFGGYLVSAAIDKCIYVTANKRFDRRIRLGYSKTEIVTSVDDVEHRICREALRLTNIDNSIELTSVADLPSNSGLGSSSSFTVALLNALHTFRRNFVNSRKLAEEACEIEIERLGEPIGKQDQYIA